MDMSLCNQAASHIKVAFKQAVFHACKRPSVKPEYTPPGATWPAVGDEFIYVRRDIPGRHRGGELTLVAENAPMRTSQVRYKDRDDYRG
jgi:hypothetical protein